MTTDTLIFKEKIIRDKDLELIFHKDVFWIYNEDPLPVIKFTLKNCKNLNEIDFCSIDCYNDGLVIFLSVGVLTNRNIAFKFPSSHNNTQTESRISILIKIYFPAASNESDVAYM